MQYKNPGFFALMDLDDDGRLKNVFWADPHSRSAYQYFGDVVTFDTTYLTNRYGMPFAPFVDEQTSWVNSDELEAASVYILDDVNVNDGVNVDEGVSSSSGNLEPYIGMEFEDVEDTQTFYKAYARRKGFAIRTNYTRLSKDAKTLCAVDYVCTRARFQQVSFIQNQAETTKPRAICTRQATWHKERQSQRPPKTTNTPLRLVFKYGQAWVATLKGDVYNFGVVMLELLTGKRPVEVFKPKMSRELVGWVQHMRSEVKQDQVFDPLLRRKGFDEEMLHVLDVSCMCVNQNPFKRPTINEVMDWLKNVHINENKNLPLNT
ncbi:hypothetical protein LWI28_011197 [Acer negundo]|uniref:Protein FAR1-RELATED SEQUENCE n=1 Tax=Acer negundo TaxID=4023 RepID=A0AAD5NX14_ACENE|nr:hypothetical protein LWI28_011197 [Acer negundo]